MNTIWTKNLKTEEEKQQFQNTLLGSRLVLERLSDILKEKAESLDRSSLTLSSFDNPNWASKEAYKNGYASCIHNLLQLINLDHKETN